MTQRIRVDFLGRRWLDGTFMIHPDREVLEVFNDIDDLLNTCGLDRRWLPRDVSNLMDIETKGMYAGNLYSGEVGVIISKILKEFYRRRSDKEYP